MVWERQVQKRKQALITKLRFEKVRSVNAFLLNMLTCIDNYIFMFTIFVCARKHWTINHQMSSYYTLMFTSMDGKRRLEFPNDPIKTILFIHVTSHLGDKFFCFSVHGMFAELFFFFVSFSKHLVNTYIDLLCYCDFIIIIISVKKQVNFITLLTRVD